MPNDWKKHRRSGSSQSTDGFATWRWWYGTPGGESGRSNNSTGTNGTDLAVEAVNRYSSGRTFRRSNCGGNRSERTVGGS